MHKKKKGGAVGTVPPNPLSLKTRGGGGGLGGGRIQGPPPSVNLCSVVATVLPDRGEVGFIFGHVILFEQCSGWPGLLLCAFSDATISPR